MQQKRKTPMRMCSGCGEMKPKNELVRVVRSSAGEINVDLTGRMPGRGAYICRDIECLRAAKKKRRFERSFDCSIDADIYDRLEKELMSDE